MVQLFKNKTPQEIQKALTTYEKNSIKSTEKSIQRNLTYQETKNIFKSDVAQYEQYLQPNHILLPIEETNTTNKESFQYEIIDLNPILENLKNISPKKIDTATIKALARKLKSQQGLKIKLIDIEKELTNFVKNQNKIDTSKPTRKIITHKQKSKLKPISNPENSGGHTRQPQSEILDQEEDLLNLTKPTPVVHDQEPESNANSSANISTEPINKPELQAELDTIQPKISALPDQEIQERQKLLQSEHAALESMLHDMPDQVSDTLLSEYQTLLNNLKKQELLEQEETNRSALTQDQKNEFFLLKNQFVQGMRNLFDLNAAVAKTKEQAKQRLTFKTNESEQREKIDQEAYEEFLKIKNKALIEKTIIKNQKAEALEQAKRKPSTKLLSEIDVDEIIQRAKITHEQINELKEIQQQVTKDKLSVAEQEQINKKIQLLKKEEQNIREQLLSNAQDSIHAIEQKLIPLKMDSQTALLQEETQKLQTMLEKQEQEMRTATTEKFEDSLLQLQKMIATIKDQQDLMFMETSNRNTTIGDESKTFNVLRKNFEQTINNFKVKEAINESLNTNQKSDNSHINHIVDAINAYKNRAKDIDTIPVINTSDPTYNIRKYESETRKDLPEYYQTTQQAIQSQLSRLSDAMPIDKEDITNFTNDILNKISEELRDIRQKTIIAASNKL